MRLHSSEHQGLRASVYPDKVLVYPYLPRKGRANPCLFSDKEKNRAKVEAARRSKAKNLIKNSVRVLAENQGIFFTVTTGLPDVPDKAISRLIEEMRRNYGLLYYCWVREDTKSGLVHWHFAAVFRQRGLKAVHFLKADKKIVELSNWWARLIGQLETGNSIRLGWAVKNNRPTKYLLDKGAADYLLKYFTKQKRSEKNMHKRLWTSNLDWLRPVRYELIKEVPLFSTARPTMHWELVENDDRYLNEIGIAAYFPGLKGRPLRLTNGIFWADLYRKPSDKYMLREIFQQNLN